MSRHTLQMPPMRSPGRASNKTTSKPWPMQCAAAVMPVMPAPMMAILGPSSIKNGGGGTGATVFAAHAAAILGQARTDSVAAAGQVRTREEAVVVAVARQARAC